MTTSTALRRVDRIGWRGDIVEHWTRDGRRTICGNTLGLTQDPAGNRPCKQCRRIVKSTSPALLESAP